MFKRLALISIPLLAFYLVLVGDSGTRPESERTDSIKGDSAQLPDVVSEDVAQERMEPRFRLGEIPEPEVSRPVRARVYPEDFEWIELTSRGGASGLDPTIGKGSGRPYFDFRDGQGYPYYVSE